MSDRIHILTDEMADDALQTACGRIRALEAANTALTEAGVRVIAQRDALEAELAEERQAVHLWNNAYHNSVNRTITIVAERDRLAEENARYRKALERIEDMPWPNSQSPYALIARRALLSEHEDSGASVEAVTLTGAQKAIANARIDRLSEARPFAEPLNPRHVAFWDALVALDALDGERSE